MNNFWYHDVPIRDPPVEGQNIVEFQERAYMKLVIVLFAESYFILPAHLLFAESRSWRPTTLTGATLHN